MICLFGDAEESRRPDYRIRVPIRMQVLLAKVQIISAFRGNDACADSKVGLPGSSSIRINNRLAILVEIKFSNMERLVDIAN